MPAGGGIGGWTQTIAWRVLCSNGEYVNLDDDTTDEWLFNTGEEACNSLNYTTGYESYTFGYSDVGEDGYWNGNSKARSFPEETSVGQIFINENSDINLISNCVLELNTGNLSDNSISDSSGNLNKGLLIGDYRIKKTEKNKPMRRDSFVKTPKKSNEDGAL